LSCSSVGREVKKNRRSYRRGGARLTAPRRTSGASRKIMALFWQTALSDPGAVHGATPVGRPRARRYPYAWRANADAWSDADPPSARTDPGCRTRNAPLWNANCLTINHRTGLDRTQRQSQSRAKSPTEHVAFLHFKMLFVYVMQNRLLSLI
jgi:hypothetical protein